MVIVVLIASVADGRVGSIHFFAQRTQPAMSHEGSIHRLVESEDIAFHVSLLGFLSRANDKTLRKACKVGLRREMQHPNSLVGKGVARVVVAQTSEFYLDGKVAVKLAPREQGTMAYKAAICIFQQHSGLSVERWGIVMHLLYAKEEVLIGHCARRKGTHFRGKCFGSSLKFFAGAAFVKVFKHGHNATQVLVADLQCFDSILESGRSGVSNDGLYTLFGLVDGSAHGFVEVCSFYLIKGGIFPRLQQYVIIHIANNAK